MQIHIENDISIIENQVDTFNLLSDRWASNLTSHRFQNLIYWFRCFSTRDDESFGTKRGRNFIGTKCWLLRPEFFIIRNENSILAIVPLFLFKFFIRQTQKYYHMLSFCPDSSIFFYQDILLEPNQRKDIINAFFDYVSLYLKGNDYLLYLGHIPEKSPNVAYIKRYLSTCVDHGYQGGCCYNYWRGGVYPWNISRMTSILNRIQNHCHIAWPDLNCEIAEIINVLQSQTEALLFFKKTQKAIEGTLINLIDRLSALPEINNLVLKLSSTLKDKPILYPFLTLPQNKDTFLNNLSKSKRYYYQRYTNKFYSAGGDFENLNSQLINNQDIEDFLDLHIMRWGSESAAIMKETLSFQKNIFRLMKTHNQLRLFFARHRGERIASVACFDINGRREFYYSGRSMKYSKLRAGKLLVHFSILDAIDKSLSIFDFGYGDDEYKFDYTTSSERLYSFILACSGHMPDSTDIFPVYEKIDIGGRA